MVNKLGGRDNMLMAHRLKIQSYLNKLNQKAKPKNKDEWQKKY